MSPSVYTDWTSFANALSRIRVVFPQSLSTSTSSHEPSESIPTNASNLAQAYHLPRRFRRSDGILTDLLANALHDYLRLGPIDIRPIQDAVQGLNKETLRGSLLRGEGALGALIRYRIMEPINEIVGDMAAARNAYISLPAGDARRWELNQLGAKGKSIPDFYLVVNDRLNPGDFKDKSVFDAAAGGLDDLVSPEVETSVAIDGRVSAIFLGDHTFFIPDAARAMYAQAWTQMAHSRSRLALLTEGERSWLFFADFDRDIIWVESFHPSRRDLFRSIFALLLALAVLPASITQFNEDSPDTVSASVQNWGPSAFPGSGGASATTPGWGSHFDIGGGGTGPRAPGATWRPGGGGGGGGWGVGWKAAAGGEAAREEKISTLTRLGQHARLDRRGGSAVASGPMDLGAAEKSTTAFSDADYGLHWRPHAGKEVFGSASARLASQAQPLGLPFVLLEPPIGERPFPYREPDLNRAPSPNSRSPSTSLGTSLSSESSDILTTPRKSQLLGDLRRLIYIQRTEATWHRASLHAKHFLSDSDALHSIDGGFTIVPGFLTDGSGSFDGRKRVSASRHDGKNGEGKERNGLRQGSTVLHTESSHAAISAVSASGAASELDVGVPSDEGLENVTVHPPPSGSAPSIVLDVGPLIGRGATWDTFAARLITQDQVPSESPESTAGQQWREGTAACAMNVVVKMSCTDLRAPQSDEADQGTANASAEILHAIHTEYQLLCGPLDHLAGKVVPICYGLFKGRLRNAIGGRDVWIMVMEDCGRSAPPNRVPLSLKNILQSHYVRLHDAGVLHGDIAWHHWRYVLRSDGTWAVRIIDFGQAHSFASIEDESSRRSRDEFMEQAKGERARVDRILAGRES